jgi:uncharacterized protein
VHQWVLPAEYTGHPAVYVVVAVLALSLTGVSKGGFGAGLGTLSIPVMMTIAPARFSLGMYLPLLIFCDILTLRHYPREWKPRPLLLLAPWMLVGIVAGAFLLDRLSPQTTKACVGGAAIGFVLLEWLRVSIKRQLDRGRVVAPFRPTLLTALPFGIAAGISTTIAHAAGAITTIYFLPQRLDKRDFVGTQARFYFTFNSIKIPFFIYLALINSETLLKSLWLAPFAPLFVWMGAAMNHRMSPELFHRVVYILLAATGAYLLYANV